MREWTEERRRDLKHRQDQRRKEKALRRPGPDLEPPAPKGDQEVDEIEQFLHGLREILPGPRAGPALVPTAGRRPPGKPLPGPAKPLPRNLTPLAPPSGPISLPISPSPAMAPPERNAPSSAEPPGGPRNLPPLVPQPLALGPGAAGPALPVGRATPGLAASGVPVLDPPPRALPSLSTLPPHEGARDVGGFSRSPEPRDAPAARPDINPPAAVLLSPDVRQSRTHVSASAQRMSGVGPPPPAVSLSPPAVSEPPPAVSAPSTAVTVEADDLIASETRSRQTLQRHEAPARLHIRHLHALELLCAVERATRRRLCALESEERGAGVVLLSWRKGHAQEQRHRTELTQKEQAERFALKVFGAGW